MTEPDHLIALDGAVAGGMRWLSGFAGRRRRKRRNIGLPESYRRPFVAHSAAGRGAGARTGGARARTRRNSARKSTLTPFTLVLCDLENTGRLLGAAIAVAIG